MKMVKHEGSPTFLSQKEVISSNGNLQSHRFSVGYVHTPGRREKMEDILNIEACFDENPFQDLFLVLDGHCGSDVPQFVGEKFHAIFKGELEKLKSYNDVEIGNLAFQHAVEVTPIDTSPEHLRVVLALHFSFEKTNKELKNLFLNNNQVDGGTTALVCFIMESTLYITNVGDTKAVLVNKNGDAIQVSVDHKPIHSEKERIEKSGGYILNISVPRVEGVLAISRSIGNFDLQEKGVTWKPHTRVIPNFLEDSWFIILASDGLWDCVSPQEAEEICDEIFYSSTSSSKSGSEHSLHFGEDSSLNLETPIDSAQKAEKIEKVMQACKELANTAWKKNSTDNIGIIIINFD